MKRFPPFFLTGSAGMVVTAVLHMAMALLLRNTSVHTSFMVLYPVFMAFMAIGAAQLKKEKQPL